MSNLKCKLEDGTFTVSGNGDMENYDWILRSPWRDNSNAIKKIIIEKGVTSIGDYSFGWCNNLTHLEISKGVTYIGNNAFEGCASLTNLKLPSSVIKIGNKAFAKCNSLINIKIPDSVTSIGDHAFWECKNLKSITLSDGMTSIGYGVFYECENLTNVIIPDSVTSIGRLAFCGCKSLKSITLSKNLTLIDEEAFSGCSNLTAVALPNNLSTIGKHAFSLCYGLKKIVIPANVTSVGEACFSSCGNLRKIYYRANSGLEYKLSQYNNAQLIPYENIPPVIEKLRWRIRDKTLSVGGVEEIEDFSSKNSPWFNKLKNIQKIIIAEGVQKISANAFIDCFHLEHIKIPASVKTIGDLAFMISYCGERTANGSRNVIWSLDNGTLVLKKNPAASKESDFSIGEITWRAIEKNIKQIKIECGVMPRNSFFEWLWKSERDVQIKLI